MPEWLQSIAGPNYAAALLWTIGALVLLIAVLVLIRLIRSMTFGTFVAGGRNRKTRLAVMDATAVDSHRRLVLVRRDDVEHLILIGGPTDVVVEQNIRLSQARRPALAGEPQQETAPRPPRPAEQQRPPQPRPVTPAPASAPPAAREQRLATPRPQEPAYAAQPQRTAPQPAPPLQRAAPTTVAQVPAPAAARDSQQREVQASAAPDDIDRALMNELSTSFDNTPSPAAKETSVSLEDEMNRLLGELSSKR
jgi:outer membrane biosynthesis protein TonB